MRRRFAGLMLLANEGHGRLCLIGTAAEVVLKAGRIRCKMGQFFGNPLVRRLPAQAIEAISVQRGLITDFGIRTYEERRQ